MDSDDLIRGIIDRNRQAVAKAKLADDYRTVDRKVLSRLSDKELAEWQGNYPPECPQFILAEYEWQRRLTEKAVGAQKFAAFMSLAGVALGAALTFGFSKLSGESRSPEPKQYSCTQEQSRYDPDHTTHDDVKRGAAGESLATRQATPPVNLVTDKDKKPDGGN